MSIIEIFYAILQAPKVLVDHSCKTSREMEGQTLPALIMIAQGKDCLTTFPTKGKAFCFFYPAFTLLRPLSTM